MYNLHPLVRVTKIILFVLFPSFLVNKNKQTKQTSKQNKNKTKQNKTKKKQKTKKQIPPSCVNRFCIKLLQFVVARNK